MREALIFMMIFGAVLLLAAARLWFSRDPGKSILLARVPGIEKMPKEKARKIAREVGAPVAGVGIAIILYCAVSLIRGVQ